MPDAKAAIMTAYPTYPVHYSVEHPPRFSRINLLVRAAAFIALGVCGLSFGTLFLAAYLIFPVIAAIRLTSTGGPDAYLRQDGPRVVAALRWIAAVCAWTGLVAERLPSRSPTETVAIEVDETVHRMATPGSAILRVITGIPSALVLAILGWLGMFVWLWAALSILVHERVGPGAFQYLVGLQRWSIRLLAYQASLVDEYPPFSFSDAAPALPAARAAT
jgi:hypothetical protein